MSALKFKKLLVANRGEIAVRVIRACRELGIPTLALYQPADIGSLHVRLSDECSLLDAPGGFLNQEAILKIARDKGADAIHPGYGYLAEQPDFVRACEEAGIAFIGQPSEVLATMRCKLDALQRAREAGYPTVEHSADAFEASDEQAVSEAAERLGYPLVIKSCYGGRGPGERMVHSADGLLKALRSARREAQAVYNCQDVYLEKAILPVIQIGVQLLCDRHGNRVHLGEIQALAQHGNRRVIAESPAPGLSPDLRERLRQAALVLASAFNLQNAGTVEFLIDGRGGFYFTEIKPRLQLEHPLIEIVSRVDLVHAQLRLAAGELLPFRQQDLQLAGHALLARVNAEDPWNAFLPSPGSLRQVWLPGGPHVRVDTYVYSGCAIPGEYDPLIAKLTVWGEERPVCLQRMRRSLEEFKLVGPPTNLSLIQNILSTAEFVRGSYVTGFRPQPDPDHRPANHLRDLAVASAVLYLMREQCYQPPAPENRENHHWQRDVRIPAQWTYTGLFNAKDGSDR